MIDMEDLSLDKRYYCFECGQQAYACELKGHVCFDRFPHLSIRFTKPKWYQRFGDWIIDNFTGILGFIGINICITVLANHIGIKGFEGLLLSIGGGFICAYAFIMARD